MFKFEENPAGAFCSIILIVFLVFCGWLFFGVNKAVKAEEQQTARVEQGDYTYYYNGVEVDGANYDYHLYRYSIDNDAKKVYMTDKPESTDTSITPLYMFMH